MRGADLTDDQVLALQAHAIATSDMHLRATTYTAMGVASSVAFMPVTEGERRKARESLAATLETMALTGERLRGIERCTGCGEPAHATETDDEGYHARCRPVAA